MNGKSPRSRETRVTGQGKTIHKRGSGLGTGPVGGGHAGRGQQGSHPSGGTPRSGRSNRPSSGRPFTRSNGNPGGIGKLLVLLLVLILGGGSTLLSNLSNSSAPQPRLPRQDKVHQVRLHRTVQIPPASKHCPAAELTWPLSLADWAAMFPAAGSRKPTPEN